MAERTGEEGDVDPEETMADSLEEFIPLRNVLERPDEFDEKAWLYLPATEKWKPESNGAVLRSDEVPPELEDDPEAGIPEFAKRNGLMQALPISTVSEIVSNARLQREGIDILTLFSAFLYYYDHDAFIEL